MYSDKYVLLLTIFRAAATVESNSHQGMNKFSIGEKQQIGWVGMKPYKNYILNIKPLEEHFVINPTECSILCMIHDICISINVIFHSNGNLSCELLEGDIFRNSTHFHKHDSSVHYAVKV